MRIEIDDINDVKRVAALKAGVECGLIVKEAPPQEVYPLFKKVQKGMAGFVEVMDENASEETKARFNHLYARYLLEEKSSARVRSVPMIAGGVAYILGLGAILVGVVAGVKGCSVEQEPSKPKLIKKAKLLPVVDNQQQLIR
ncbi:MAG: hypothetical protein IJY92_07440 [Alphaproteobacteria bacterium]|nr:hypothetical protein [Alphaproteobacteria bacterium]